MSDPSDLLFTRNHEWVRVKDSKTIIVGISDYAQAHLAEVTHVDVPEPDDQMLEAGEEIGVIESLKNSVPLHCPVSGQITASNDELLSNPEAINEDPYGAGWIFEMKIKNPRELSSLANADEYENHFAEDEEE